MIDLALAPETLALQGLKALILVAVGFGATKEPALSLPKGRALTQPENDL